MVNAMENQNTDNIKLKDILALAVDMMEQDKSALEKRMELLEKMMKEQEQLVDRLQRHIGEQENMISALMQRLQQTGSPVCEPELNNGEELSEMENLQYQADADVVEQEETLVVQEDFDSEDRVEDGCVPESDGNVENTIELEYADEIGHSDEPENRDEMTSVGQDDEPSVVEAVEEEAIPDTLAGLGVLAFADELAEKANEAAPGSDVFELMARQEEREEVLGETLEREKDVKIVNDAAKPDWYDWEVDYPAEYVSDVYKAISFNDRFEFIKELFNLSGDLSEAEYLFKDTLDDINEMENFKQVVEYTRHRFPQWDEQSDEVYRFYMAIRRKFNKQ